MLQPYRRHLKSCLHQSKGARYTLCQCPIWAYGTLNGKLFRQSLRTSNGQYAGEILDALESGRTIFLRDVEPSQRTIKDAVAAFLEACKARAIRESTIRCYRRALTQLEGSQALETANVNFMYNHQAKRRISPASWRKELQIIRGFFGWCVSRKWMAENPAKALKMPRVAELKTQPFTAEEVSKLCCACDEIAAESPNETSYIRKRARALLLVMLYSGLRVSDVAKLRRSALEPSGHLVLKILKTGVRLKVLLHPDAVKALQAMPALSAEYFFWSGRGSLATCTRNIRRTIQRLGDIAGVHAHPHRFRDHFAVELLTTGADIRTVQKLLGHSSVRTTELHYGHFVAAHQALLDNATSRLDFTDSPGTPLLMKPRNNRGRNT
jgi:site-specific recombinase XerD